MLSDTKSKLAEWLQDPEYLREYGAARMKSELALLLVEARDTKSLTQRQLAEIMGVTQAYIAKLEGGEANPTIGHVGAMLAAMGLRVRFILEPLLTAEPGPDQMLSKMEMTTH